MLGAFLFAMFYSLFDSAGATVAGVLLLLIGLVLLTGKALVPIIAEKFPEMFESIKKTFSEKVSRDKIEKKQKKEEHRKKTRSRRSEVNEKAVIAEPIIEDIPSQPIISTFTEQIDKRAKDEEAAALEKVVVEDVAVSNISAIIGEEENESYILPPTTLLTETPYNDQSGEYDSIQENAQKLEDTFLSFGVKARVVQVHLGPAVTKYEVLPATGVKVSRIVSLTDDLALALAASAIRIEAPIPGNLRLALKCRIVMLRSLVFGKSLKQKKIIHPMRN